MPFCALSWAVFRAGSILPADLLPGHQRIADQSAALQVFPVQVHGGDLAVFVGGVVVNAPVGIAAAGVNGDLVPAVPGAHAAPGMGHGAQNMKELTDTLLLARAGDCVQLCKGGPDKAGDGRQVAGHPQHTHALAIRL